MTATLGSLQLMHRLLVTTGLALGFAAVSIDQPGHYGRAWSEVVAIHELSTRPDFTKAREKIFMDAYEVFFRSPSLWLGPPPSGDAPSTFAAISDSKIGLSSHFVIDNYDCAFANEGCAAVKDYVNHLSRFSIDDFAIWQLPDSSGFRSAISSAIQHARFTSIRQVTLRSKDPTHCYVNILGSADPKADCISDGSPKGCWLETSGIFRCGLNGSDLIRANPKFASDLATIQEQLRKAKLVVLYKGQPQVLPGLTEVADEFKGDNIDQFKDDLHLKAKAEYNKQEFPIMGMSLNSWLCALAGVAIQTILLLFILAHLISLQSSGEHEAEDIKDFPLFAVLRNWPGILVMLLSIVGPLLVTDALIWMVNGPDFRQQHFGSLFRLDLLPLVVFTMVYCSLAWRIASLTRSIVSRTWRTAGIVRDIRE